MPKLLEMQRPLSYASLIQIDASKILVPAALNLIIKINYLDYKKLFLSSVQSQSVQLHTETGRLVPFAGTGKVVLTLKFKSFD